MQTIPFSKQLYEETKSIHEQVESMDFVVLLRNQKLSKNDYIQYLTDLKMIYQALEEGMRDNLKSPAVHALYDEKLCRTRMLEADIRSFQGERCTPTQAAQDYARYLKELSLQRPLLLIAHAYVRYLGDLSGGRMIKKFVDQLFPGEHTNFYNFDELLGKDAPGAKFIEYKNAWKGKLDGLTLSEEKRGMLIEEAKKSFEYAGRMFGSYCKSK